MIHSGAGGSGQGLCAPSPFRWREGLEGGCWGCRVDDGRWPVSRGGEMSSLAGEDMVRGEKGQMPGVFGR